MKLTVTLDNRWFEVAIEDQRRRRARRFTAAMTKVGERLKSEIRAQVQAAGLGVNLARAVRLESYPRARSSLTPAALVYSKATALHRAFNEGAVISARGRKWLAIPTDEAERLGLAKSWRGRRGRELSGAALPRRASNVALAAKKFPDLHFERVAAGRAILVAGKGARRVVLFVLVPTVRIAKRLDLEGAARAAQGRLRHEIEIASRD